MTITRELAAFAAETDAAAIPAEVIDRARALLTDLAGSAIQAAHDAESTPAILAMLERRGLAGEGPVPSSGCRGASVRGRRRC